MTAQWPMFLAAFLSGCIGAMVGFYWGWKCGRKYGEAEGVKWATERIKEASQMMKRP